MALAARNATKSRFPIATATSPALKFAAVTPSDSANLALGSNSMYARALYVGGAGNVTVVSAADDSETPITFAGVAAGTILPIQVRAVMATNTTATSIVALFD